MILTCVSLDVLEKKSPAFIILKSNNTILTDVASAVKRMQLELKLLEETADTVKEFESHVSRFKSTGYEDGQKFSNKETVLC